MMINSLNRWEAFLVSEEWASLAEMLDKQLEAVRATQDTDPEAVELWRAQGAVMQIQNFKYSVEKDMVAELKEKGER